MTLRGLFERDATVIELWGSHHRENWHRIAAARGPHIAGLCGVRYRWLKVRIRTTLRKGDFPGSPDIHDSLTPVLLLFQPQPREDLEDSGALHSCLPNLHICIIRQKIMTHIGGIPAE